MLCCRSGSPHRGCSGFLLQGIAALFLIHACTMLLIKGWNRGRKYGNSLKHVRKIVLLSFCIHTRGCRLPSYLEASMLEIIYFSAALVYTLRVMFFVIGAARERRKVAPQLTEFPFVSIIVPARNEELNIVRCIESLAALNYPTERFEVIVVNDRSTDATGTVLLLQQQRFPNLRVLHIENEGEKNLRGKAGALDKGIAIARGEILLMTDADCVAHPQWLLCHAQEYANPSTAMVCAYTLIDGERIFDKIQAVEWNSTHTMASAGVYFKQYLGCFGNNLSIRKSIYEEIGGYSSIPFSVTEDLALLQTVGHSGYGVRYLCSPESSVHTQPCHTFGEYLRQHKRWAHGATGLGWQATVFVLSSAALWTGLASALIFEEWLWFAGILSVRVTGDYAINAPALRTLRRNALLPYNIPAVIFFTVLELILPFLLLDKTIVWKGQSFRKS